jgi:hypothetical protein
MTGQDVKEMVVHALLEAETRGVDDVDEIAEIVVRTLLVNRVIAFAEAAENER